MLYNHLLKLSETFVSSQSLKSQLYSLRSKIIEAAQKILDEWSQDEEGMDEEFGGGGACDQISNAITDIIGQNIPNVNFMDGGMEGDDHAYPIIYNDEKAFIIDIPNYIYEIGGGYSWRKIPNVILKENDVVIEEIDRSLIEENDI
jgi:hypothetical protein